MGIDAVFYDDFAQLARPRTLASTLVVYDEVSHQMHTLDDIFDLAALRRDLLDVRERISAAFTALYEKEGREIW